MGIIKLPKPYISNSQLMLFERDPMAYYEQYFVARVDEPTQKMTFGKIFQEAWCDRKYDYERALTDGGFTSDKIRVIKNAINHADAVRLPKSKTEKKMSVSHPDIIGGYKLLSIMDGLETDSRTITENKMGAWWTEKTVAESSQITWYMLSCLIRYGKPFKLRLQSYNANSGIPRVFWPKRTKPDYDALIVRINSMITRIEAGDFERY